MELSCQLSGASTGIDVHDREPILISLDELSEGTRLEVICTVVTKTGDRQNGKDGSGLGAQLSNRIYLSNCGMGGRIARPGQRFSDGRPLALLAALSTGNHVIPVRRR